MMAELSTIDVNALNEILPENETKKTTTTTGYIMFQRFNSVRCFISFHFI